MTAVFAGGGGGNITFNEQGAFAPATTGTFEHIAVEFESRNFDGFNGFHNVFLLGIIKIKC